MLNVKNKQKSANEKAKTFSGLKIDRLGQSGDGMVLIDGVPVSFPLTAPGDIIDASVKFSSAGKKTEIQSYKIISPGEARRIPPCSFHAHADKKGCGGCALQHLSEETYRKWKHSLAETCLRKSGLNTDNINILPLVSVPEHTRSRAVLSAYCDAANSVSVGFYEGNSNNVCAWDECIILHPILVSLKSRISALLRPIMNKGDKARIHCTAIENMTDIMLMLQQNIPQHKLDITVKTAKELNIGRLSVKLLSDSDDAPANVIAEFAQIIKSCGKYNIELPVGAFLQPSAEGEQALLDAVTSYIKYLSDISRVMDLFCGIGTFTLPLYERFPGLKSIQAYDYAGPAIKTLHNASQKYALTALTASERDLFKNPVSANDLKRMDIVVIDPPRIGAKEQAQELAKSRVPHIVMVSCNPQTMSRDAKILCDGGYKLHSVTPVDQFLWSAHLETVAYFTK